MMTLLKHAKFDPTLSDIDFKNEMTETTRKLDKNDIDVCVTFLSLTSLLQLKHGISIVSYSDSIW